MMNDETQLIVNFITIAENNATSCKEMLEFLRKDFEDDGYLSTLLDLEGFRRLVCISHLKYNYEEGGQSLFSWLALEGRECSSSQ